MATSRTRILMRDDQLGDDLEHLVTDLFPGGVVGLDGQVARSLCLKDGLWLCTDPTGSGLMGTAIDSGANPS